MPGNETTWTPRPLSHHSNLINLILNIKSYQRIGHNIFETGTRTGLIGLKYSQEVFLQPHRQAHHNQFLFVHDIHNKTSICSRHGT